MPRWIDKLDAQDRRVYLIWARGTLLAYAILFATLLCTLIGAPLIATWVAQAIDLGFADTPRPASTDPDDGVGKGTDGIASSSIAAERKAAAQREFRRQAAFR